MINEKFLNKDIEFMQNSIKEFFKKIDANYKYTSTSGDEGVFYVKKLKAFYFFYFKYNLFIFKSTDTEKYDLKDLFYHMKKTIGYEYNYDIHYDEIEVDPNINESYEREEYDEEIMAYPDSQIEHNDVFEIDEAVSDDYDEENLDYIAKKLNYTWRKINDKGAGVMRSPSGNIYFYDLPPKYITIASSSVNNDDRSSMKELYRDLKVIDDEYDVTYDMGDQKIYIEHANDLYENSLNENNTDRAEYVEAYNELKRVSDKIGANEFINEFISYLGEKKALDIIDRIKNRYHVDNKIDNTQSDTKENNSSSFKVESIAIKTKKDSLNEENLDDNSEEDIQVKSHKINLDDDKTVVLDDIEKSDELDLDDEETNDDIDELDIFRNFIEQELAKVEPDRSEMTFSANNITYKGYPLAKIDDKYFLFKIGDKTKKVDISLVDLDNIFVKDQLDVEK